MHKSSDLAASGMSALVTQISPNQNGTSIQSIDDLFCTVHFTEASNVLFFRTVIEARMVQKVLEFLAALPILAPCLQLDEHPTSQVPICTWLYRISG